MFLSRALVSASFFLALAGVGALAQTPITSLPKPPGTQQDSPPPDTQQQPVYTPDNSVPEGSVHPITSLPKPPGASVDTNVPAAQPAASSQPAYTPAPYTPVVPDVTTTPATPSVATPAEAAPAVNAPVYVKPSSSAPALVAAPPAPTPTLDAPLRASHVQDDAVVVRNAPPRIHAFSTFAIQFKVGTAGIGFDAATPLAQHFDLRGGGSIFSYSGSYDDSGDDITGAAQFRTGEFYLDYYPWSHGPFRLSAGIVIDGNYLNAKTLVKGGEQFDLDDQTYYSSTTDPVHGTATFNFGRKVAPSFTIGLGSMIPRTGKHVSFPFEVGFMYIGAPTVGLTLMGTVCDQSTPPNCEKIDNDPEAQADLQQEVNNINADIRFLRFYPIVSQGVSIKF